MRIHITGANGFIGRRLVAALLQQGHALRVLTRKSPGAFPPAVEVVAGDLTSADCPLEHFVRDCDVLIHCAGEIRDVGAMRSLHVEGTRKLIQAVVEESRRAGKIIHWVQLSSVGAYGPAPGKPDADRIVTEETPPRPVNEYELTKTISDDLVVKASADGQFTHSILRPSNVIGLQASDRFFPRLIKLIRRNQFFYIGRTGAIAAYIHVDDVVAALIALATSQRAKGHIYNLSFDCKLEEIVNHIAVRLGTQAPQIRVPAPLIQLPIRAFNAIFGKWVRLPSFNALTLRTRYPTTKIETELGFSFSKPLPQAIDELIEVRS